MDGTLRDDGTLGGGGSYLPLFIFLIVLSFQALDAVLKVLKKRGSSSREQTQLRQEMKQLLQEASKLSTPSTFAQAAKLRRMAAAKEKELLKYQEQQKKDSSPFNDAYARLLSAFTALLYLVLCWWFWNTPIAAVPQHLLHPFGRFLSWRASDSSGFTKIGIIPWLILTSRVSRCVSQKISEAIAPK